LPRLSKRFIDGIAVPATGDTFAWDSELPGFGLRTKPSGVKTFLIQYRNKHGQSRRFTLGRFGVLTPEQAKAEARLKLAIVASGGDPAQDRSDDRKATTVAELCREYLAKADQGLILKRRSGKPKKATTLYTDRGRIERHIIPLLGSRPVKSVTPADVRKFLHDIISGKTKADVKTKARGRAIVRGGRGTGARTLGLLGGIFTYAQQANFRPDNPVTGVQRPADKRRRIHLDAASYQQFGAAVSAAEQNGEHWQATLAMRLLALTGCRRGEIETLQRSEIDLAAQVLRLGDTKTGYSVRPLGRAAVDVLAVALRRTNSVYVLPSVRTEDKHYAGLPKAWQRHITGNLSFALSPHGLRHGFASAGEEIGLTIPTIKALLGHAGSSITESYIHKPDAALIAAADRLAAHIANAMNERRA
jgi:integrase